MRRILVGLMLATILVQGTYCDQIMYTVSAATNAVSGLNQVLDGVNIATSYSKIRIMRITVTNSDSNIAQTVSLYDTCTTTSTITKRWEVDLSTGSSGTSLVQESFDEATPFLAATGLAIRKSSVLSNVKVNILYK